MDQNSGLIVLGGAIGSAKLVEKLLGPTADYVGGGVKNWTEKRVNNVKRIFGKAADRLGPKLDEPGAVPPRVLKGVLDDGSFCDDELSAEYFGGVLASSRSAVPRDDRGLTFLNVVSNLSAYQVRSHYVFYTLFKKYFNGAKFKTVYPVGNGPYHKIYVPFGVYAAAMDLQEGENVGEIAAHSLFGLDRHRLIYEFAYGGVEEVVLELYREANPGLEAPNEGIIVGLSPFGAELFSWVHGKSDFQSVNDFSDPDTTFESTAGINVPEGSLKLPPNYIL
jgi:hypothetical protein